MSFSAEDWKSLILPALAIIGGTLVMTFSPYSDMRYLGFGLASYSIGFKGLDFLNAVHSRSTDAKLQLNDAALNANPPTKPQ